MKAFLKKVLSKNHLCHNCNKKIHYSKKDIVTHRGRMFQVKFKVINCPHCNSKNVLE